MAPPELNIFIKPMGANLHPLLNIFTGTTVKTSYCRAFKVIGIVASFGRLFIMNDIGFSDSTPPCPLAVEYSHHSSELVQIPNL
ncbi:hypothetical protein V6Z11_D13G154700 [Gossypium hirsutum]